MRITILYLFLLLFPSFVIAQKTNDWKTATSNGYTYKYIPNDPMKVRFYTLKNGLTVILSENKKEPRVAVNIAVRAGSNTDPKTHTGLAHYLEHILFKGTDKFGTLDYAKEKPYLDSITNLYEKYTTLTDAGERKKTYAEIDRLSGIASHYSIANEYDKLMSDLGSQGTNAHTWYEETVYKENIPANAMEKFLLIQAERFRKPVIRLFHTELEAVYEEKNRSLDNDGRKAFEVMSYNLFPTHNYGQQSTIGTIEHLKNPSIVAIQEYYNKYYVPNNMAIIMSGDFKSDDLIRQIDRHFAYMKSKPLSLYNPAHEKPLTSVIEKDVYGPSSENIIIGYRTPASGTQDALILDVIAELLSNGSAGLFDISLNKQQKVQSSDASLQQLKDYGIFMLSASPKEGQSLEDLKPLLLEQLARIKNGDFDQTLVKAIVANYKLQELRANENNGFRINMMLTSFIQSRGEDWNKRVKNTDNMAGVSKADIQRVANKYFGNNYVLVNKRKGVDKEIAKVDKPAITPVETNAGTASKYVQEISAMKTEDIKPQWIDYEKAISNSKAGIADVMHVQNKENDLFYLNYYFDMGSWNQKLLPYAVEYLSFLGTDKMSPEELSREFYNLASNYKISVSSENINVSISGLQENFSKAVALFEDVIANCKPDDAALELLKGRWLKARDNSKLNKGAILSGLRSYAIYGAKNPFNTVLSNEELKGLTSQQLVGLLHNLLNYKHSILYYGPQTVGEFSASISKLHKVPAQFTAAPAKADFQFVKQNKNAVLFADYDMVQSEIMWVRNIRPYTFKDEAAISVFNNYFGGGMGSLVFQTIRESKALAYSTMASYIVPGKQEDPYMAVAYVGSQADKMNEAIDAMNELLNDLPKSDRAYKLAIEAVKKDVETERIPDNSILFSYINAQKKGFSKDYRKDIYEQILKVGFDDIKQLHDRDLSDQAYTYAIVASKDKVKKEDMEKIGEVKELSLEEIFGY